MEEARLFFVDNLRILLIALVILLHLSVTYGGVGGWYYKEGQPDTVSFIVLTLPSYMFSGGTWPKQRHRPCRTTARCLTTGRF